MSAADVVAAVRALVRPRGRHRRRTVPVWTVGVVAGALVAALASWTAALANADPPAAPPPVVVTVPAAAAPPTMVVYDDDRERGRHRCEAWTSLYSASDGARCTTRPTAAGPDPARARAGQEWWDNRYPRDDEPRGGGER